MSDTEADAILRTIAESVQTYDQVVEVYGGASIVIMV